MLLGLLMAPAIQAQRAHRVLLGTDQCAAKARGHALRLTPARASQATAAFDATYYHLTLKVQLDPAYVTGVTRIEGRAVGTVLDTLTLDLLNTLQVDAVTLDNGTALGFIHTDDRLVIPLPAAVASSNTVALDVAYQGVPEQKDLGTFVFGDTWFWTLSEPYGARGWWPCKDHPSDKADSVRVTVTVPEPLRVGAPGLLTAETHHADGTATYDWTSRYPIAPYLVSVTAGVYDVFEQTYTRPDSLAALHGPLDLPVLHYAYPGSGVYEGGDIFSGWSRVVDVFPVLEHWFGAYPFEAEKYGHAHFTFGGGMEHQTMSSMGSAWLGLVVHELGHQWFGDAISPATWPELWLNEGFATLSELLFWEAAGDAYQETYDVIFDLYWERARLAQGTVVLQDTTDVSGMFAHPRVYSKGGMVLHMLRHMVGDDTFREILHTYSTDPVLRYGTATTADFQRVVEAVTGEDYATFFRQWVTEGTGEPEYAVTWSTERDGFLHAVSVTVEQTQSEAASNIEVFEMPVTLVITTERGVEKRFTVRNDQRVQTFTFSLGQPPASVAFDPDRHLLRNADVTVVDTEPVPLPATRTRIAAHYPNPASDVLEVEIALAEAGPVRLVLYDALGRHVHTVYEGWKPVGTHHHRAVLERLAAGTLLLRLETPTAVDSVPVLILP